MRVSVTITADVDLDAYRYEYSDDTETAASAAEHVRAMMAEGAIAALAPFSDGGYVRGIVRGYGAER